MRPPARRRPPRGACGSVPGTPHPGPGARPPRGAGLGGRRGPAAAPGFLATFPAAAAGGAARAARTLCRRRCQAGARRGEGCGGGEWASWGNPARKPPGGRGWGAPCTGFLIARGVGVALEVALDSKPPLAKEDGTLPARWLRHWVGYPAKGDRCRRPLGWRMESRRP